MKIMKICLATVLALALTLGTIPVSAADTSNDISHLASYLLGTQSLTEDDIALLDRDKNGVLNGIDLTLLRIEANNISADSPDDTSLTLDTSATIIADFREGNSPLFYASNGWSNGDPFDCIWRSANVSFVDDCLALTIDTDNSNDYAYSAAEYRSNAFYDYGYYETSMRPIANMGVCSSFFTYTGPSDGNPWDEIDIEFLGYDTTRVQLNYYTNGVGNHEVMIDLGFDAATDYHTYGFDWESDSITWYVDRVPVYTATTNIPSTPSRIMVNVWNGTGVDSWLGTYDGTTPLTAYYQWITYKMNE